MEGEPGMQEVELAGAIKNYIGQFIVKRHRLAKLRSDRKNLVIYDLDKYEVLETFARANNTNVSSILNNLYEGFLKAVQSPQKTIDAFDTEIKFPDVGDSKETWENFYKTLNMEEFKKLDEKVNMILNLHNQRWRHLK